MSKPSAIDAALAEFHNHPDRVAFRTAVRDLAKLLFAPVTRVANRVVRYLSDYAGDT